VQLIGLAGLTGGWGVAGGVWHGLETGHSSRYRQGLYSESLTITALAERAMSRIPARGV